MIFLLRGLDFRTATSSPHILYQNELSRLLWNQWRPNLSAGPPPTQCHSTSSALRALRSRTLSTVQSTPSPAAIRQQTTMAPSST